MKTKKRVRRSKPTPAFAFNHVMLYVRDVRASLKFYVGELGFHILESDEHNGSLTYARLLPPNGQTTLSLHPPEIGQTNLESSGVRLYFEVKELDAACRMLEKAGVKFLGPPKQMPWGWRHAYLLDPDGHEISLYWAGASRLRTFSAK